MRKERNSPFPPSSSEPMMTASRGQAKPPRRAWKTDCAIMTSSTPDFVIAAGSKMGDGGFPAILAELVRDNPENADPWMGFRLGFTLGTPDDG